MGFLDKFKRDKKKRDSGSTQRYNQENDFVTPIVATTILTDQSGVPRDEVQLHESEKTVQPSTDGAPDGGYDHSRSSDPSPGNFDSGSSSSDYGSSYDSGSSSSSYDSGSSSSDSGGGGFD